ncbi:MAG TPA: hypothetical protein HA326_04705 [Thermoplasmata archaeon]|nr:hypothetical protein [Thermoplasmata archaeon]
MHRVVRIGACLLVGLALLVAAWGVVEAKAPSTAAWTVMVYLDGDNNLDPDAHVDMAEMAAVGSTASVNVVVLLDEFDGPANLLKVNLGGSQIVNGFPLNGKEADMGDGATLATFVDFVVAKFPARHYLLDLWDHGDDFRGFAWDDHPYADGSLGSDFMTHTEIINALAGHHFDVLAFDGCVMSNLEVAYEYAARGVSADYLVASEEYIPNQGFAYDTILGPLVANPSMDGYALAKAIVDSYVAYYDGGGWQVGLSVIKLAEAPTLVGAVFDLASALEANMPAYRDCIGEGRGAAHLGWSMYGWEAFVDFPTWATTVRSCLGPDAWLGPLFDGVDAGLASAVLYVRNAHALDVKGAGGVGVFYPGSEGSFVKNVYWHGDYFLGTRFAADGWYAFLQAYWGGK